MKRSHSPAPWAVVGELTRRTVKDAKGKTVVVIERWTTESDAQLIARAPVILAALKPFAEMAMSAETPGVARNDELDELIGAARVAVTNLGAA